MHTYIHSYTYILTDDSIHKDIFDLKTHTLHFIYGYMVNNYSDSEREIPLPPTHA